MGLVAHGGQLGGVGRAVFSWCGGLSSLLRPEFKGQLGRGAQELVHHLSSAVEELQLASAA